MVKKCALQAQQENSIQFTGLSHMAPGAARGTLPWWSAPAAHKLCRGNKRTGQTLLRRSPALHFSLSTIHNIQLPPPTHTHTLLIQRCSNPTDCQLGDKIKGNERQVLMVTAGERRWHIQPHNVFIYGEMWIIWALVLQLCFRLLCPPPVHLPNPRMTH